MIKAPKAPFMCLQCHLVRLPKRQRLLRDFTTTRLLSSSSRRYNSTTSTDSANSKSNDILIQSRPPTAPKPNIDIKHIRGNPSLYKKNCKERNYKAQSAYPSRIIELFAQLQASRIDSRSLRERGNALRRQIAATIQQEDEETESKSKSGETPDGTTPDGDIKSMSKEQLIEKARIVKKKLSAIVADEDRYKAQATELALAIPNLTSAQTPRGDEPRVLSFINDHPEPEPSSSDRVWRSHVHIGSELGILDFAGAATTSGWGWYFLVDEGAQLEQALVNYALAVATKKGLGWRQVSPPSIVYSHIGAACGFQPRDQNGEQQIYALKGQPEKPELCLAGTAEIPLAGMKADSVLEEADVPLKHVAVSRCYRAEAGARGADTKGLYRVHEFTKVEMFAWTRPELAATKDVFNEMLGLQKEILRGLGLHCRVLEMPTADLGASAYRKVDIEAFFPSRRDPEHVGGERDGWGEVTSASVCTDYQTRRLATRLRTAKKMTYPWTVNGTALAVPRVLAAVLENGWDEADMSVTIPEILRPWMGGREKIEMKHRRQ
ncbi:seryl-tRNA synthetase [Annulohypoxylon truncatum]|uniref:seryl-tRNA synthetase n=1 Tax=Annulohypoxylon truncatum TaxID=327061 RepID=UPI002007795C|nr:seryl-tRNA synthetase [Annulohypoxylon truncatum]KAI1213689.1 seryl-tRNA synthetase [Annulohypoxylon truncatum]